MEQKNYTYTLQMTEKQAKILSYACDRLARLIQGQDWAYQELMEEAWEKRCKKATGKTMDKEWDGGWYNVRHEAEELSKKIKKRFWNLDWCELNGIHYDDTADILFDLHRIIRHQLWLDNPNRSNITVDSENPSYSIGSEPLAKIYKNDDKNN